MTGVPVVGCAVLKPGECRIEVWRGYACDYPFTVVVYRRGVGEFVLWSEPTYRAVEYWAWCNRYRIVAVADPMT